MILFLTMAGRYQRFTDEGYKLPKYLLPWGEKTVLSAIIGELQSERAFGDVFLIANHRDEAYMPHVHAIMRKHEIPSDHLILTHDTKGQAATAMIGIETIAHAGLARDRAVVFHNIDTILRNRNVSEIAPALAKNDGYIDVFTSNNANYSYVLTNESSVVVEIAEKIVVSDLATSGLYGFKNADTFRHNYVPDEDLYISAVYKRMIAKGARIVAGELHRESDTVVLGTPAEYLNASLVAL